MSDPHFISTSLPLYFPLYIAGVGIIIPSLPKLSTALGASAIQYGMLQTAMAYIKYSFLGLSM